jgi:hypothetical protein
VRACLEFDLPEQKAELEVAVSGQAYLATLQDFDAWVREEVRTHGGDSWPALVRDTLYALLGQHGATLYGP